MRQAVFSAALILGLCGSAWPFSPGDLHVFDVTHAPFGAKGDGVTDDTKAFQDALHQAGEGENGGVVFVPRGHYLISGNLRFRPNVTMEGVCDFPHHSPQFWFAEIADRKLPGSVLLVTGGEGQEDGPPFIALHTNSAIKGLTIYYPNQIKANPPNPYPWTVAVTEGGADHCTILNVLMVNPYKAVDFGSSPSGRHFIQNLYAYPLYRGLYVDQCYDIGRIENIHFWPFWGYTGDDDPVGQFVSENAEAFIFGRTDWEYVNNCFAIFYKVGFHFIKTNAGSPNVLLTQSGSDIGPFAVLVEDCQSHAGVSFSNSQLFGRIAVMASNSGPVRFTGCGFFGATREKEVQEPIHLDVAGSGHVSLENCHLITLDPKNTAKNSIRAHGGGLAVSNCLFMDVGRTQFSLEDGLRSAVISGNTFRGALTLENNSHANVQTGLNVDERAPVEAGAIIVDNTDPDAFSTEGEWFLGQGGGDYMSVLSWAEKGDGSCKAFWRPELAAGVYDVLIWYGGDPYQNHATDAPFMVRDAEGEREIRVNLRENTGQWVSLGEFRFDSGRGGHVMTHNGANGNVVADAVKFVPKP